MISKIIYSNYVFIVNLYHHTTNLLLLGIVTKRVKKYRDTYTLQERERERERIKIHVFTA